jgi:hypothetical protein
MQSEYVQTTVEAAIRLMAFDVLFVDENLNDLKYYPELFETEGLSRNRSIKNLFALRKIWS